MQHSVLWQCLAIPAYLLSISRWHTQEMTSIQFLLSFTFIFAAGSQSQMHLAQCTLIFSCILSIFSDCADDVLVQSCGNTVTYRKCGWHVVHFDSDARRKTVRLTTCWVYETKPQLNLNVELRSVHVPHVSEAYDTLSLHTFTSATIVTCSNPNQLIVACNTRVCTVIRCHVCQKKSGVSWGSCHMRPNVK